MQLQDNLHVLQYFSYYSWDDFITNKLVFITFITLECSIYIVHMKLLFMIIDLSFFGKYFYCVLINNKHSLIQIFKLPI